MKFVFKFYYCNKHAGGWFIGIGANPDEAYRWYVNHTSGSCIWNKGVTEVKVDPDLKAADYV